MDRKAVESSTQGHSRAESSRETNDPSGYGHTGPSDDRPQLTRSMSRMSSNPTTEYKLYKRRFFGLVQLILLNIVVSWAWTSFAPISSTAASYFNTTESNINWLSIMYFFAYVVATPFTFYALNKHGPKTSIVISAVLLLIGNWVKYAGAKTNHFPVLMLGQVFIGLSQPFVLSTPSTYSNLWFSPSGRTTTTAVGTLANPFGAALGQLVSPFWTQSPSDVPNTVLYTTIIATVAALPAFFIPKEPPTPPTAAVSSNNTNKPPSLSELKTLSRSLEFYLIFIAFSVYVGFFNAFSSLTNQILAPYGFSQDDAGIAGAILIVVGLVWAAVSSPFVDKYKVHLIYIKVAVPTIALMYLVFIFAPPTRSIPFVYVICGILGSACFGLVPVVLEFLVEIQYPLGPETGSSMCWAGGQLLGGIFVIVMDRLKDSTGNPNNNMQRALIFEAVVGLVVVPLPLALGWFGRGAFVRMRRWELEKRPLGNVDFDNEDDDEVRVLAHEGNGRLRI